MNGATETINTKFGTRLRELRQARGLSQEALADAAQLDRTYLGGVERGERNLTLRNIEKIAKALDLNIAELFGGIE